MVRRLNTALSPSLNVRVSGVMVSTCLNSFCGVTGSGMWISGFSSRQDQTVPAISAVSNSDLIFVSNDFCIAGANLQLLRIMRTLFLKKVYLH